MEISEWISGHFNSSTDISLHFSVLKSGSLHTQYPVVLASAYVFLFKKTQRKTFIQIYCLLYEIFGVFFFFSQDNKKKEGILNRYLFIVMNIFIIPIICSCWAGWEYQKFSMLLLWNNCVQIPQRKKMCSFCYNCLSFGLPQT